MAIKTNLNAQPYYDDFAENSEFYRVLFRPGFSIQARELTQLQSIQQNQIEKFGSHMFDEGAMVIPGNSAIDVEYHALKLQATYSTESVEDYRTDYIGAVLTGGTSGVTATVVNTVAATSEDPLTLYVKYMSSGTDKVTSVFADNEYISANKAIGSFGAGVASSQALSVDATAIGSSTSVSEGVYFVHGHFVKCQAETLILDKYTDIPSYRIGFDVTETLVTPELDASLLDNATGASNYSAKGAHRLRINLKLTKKSLTDLSDENFVELKRLDRGLLQSSVETSDYSEIAKTLARRTYDESGDYVVDPFNIETREHLNDGTNFGILEASAGGDESNLMLSLDPGKAYVRGFEIKTIATEHIVLPKARDFDSTNNAVTPASLGNYLQIANVYGTPDITSISGEAEAFKQVSLYSTQTTTGGVSSGSQIGYARTRTLEYASGTDAGHADAVFNLYLFDIQMTTDITLLATATLTDGARITGGSSGAYGYVASGSGTAYKLIQVSGTFSSTEALTSSVDGDGSPTLSAVVSNRLDKVKQVFMDDADGGQDFTADAVLNSDFNLAGTVTATAASTAVVGLTTKFVSELAVGDIITIPSGTSGAVEELVVSAVTSDTAITVTGTITTTGTYSAVRTRTRLQEQEELVTIYKLPKSNIKTLLTETNGGISDSTLTLKRQFVGTTTTSGTVTFTVGSNEVFGAFSSTDYILSVLTAVSGTVNQGDILDLTGTGVVTGDGTSALTITDSAFGTTGGNKVKLIASVVKTLASHKTKTLNKSQQKTISATTSTSDVFGSRVSDKQLSLGTADISEVRAVYSSAAIADTPVTPTLTFSSVSSVSFEAGSTITGATTGATGNVISYNSSTSVLSYYVVSGVFSASETINYNTTDTATITATTPGDTNILSSFLFDDGQRDSFYDIGSLHRKPTASIPSTQLLIIYDYFSHGGSGEFFSVDSYTGQVAYSDIPMYSASRVDPDAIRPSGDYELKDSLDFRSRVGDNTATNPFIFTNRSYDSSGSSSYDLPKADSLVRVDYEFYLNRVDALYLTPAGEFVIQSGESAERPEPPADLVEAMKLAEIGIPAYTHSPKSLIIKPVDNSRYTMRDIGKLDKRINNLEYYTALSMLENETNSMQIQDGNGMDRFKSGFLVDNFSGHKVGDVGHADYNCAIDMQAGLLRPRSYLDNVELKEINESETARSAKNYTRTGPILSLPYEHISTISQTFASRVENINPYQVQSWVGFMELTPSSDTWVETKTAPDIVTDAEGDYAATKARLKDSLGTVWGSWKTAWTGTKSTSVHRGGHWWGWGMASYWWGWGGRTYTTTTTTSRLERMGVNTTIAESFERKLVGTKVIDSAVIPFMRKKDIAVSVIGMKPKTKFYPFFDSKSIASHFTNEGEEISTEFVTDEKGSYKGTFHLKNNETTKFRSGAKVLRLTDRADNSLIPGFAKTSAEAIYTSTGVLNTEQSSYLSIRNAEVSTSTVFDSKTTTSSVTTSHRRRYHHWGWGYGGYGYGYDGYWGSHCRWLDPLAQSFLVDSEGGMFATKVDIYFSSKDAALPVTLSIHTMENGTPTSDVIPFSVVGLYPSDVNVSEGGEVVTSFVFSAPIHLKDGEEYAIQLETNSLDYNVWISQLGEEDVISGDSISAQPHQGSLFKSQNSSTWTASQLEDLKFVIHKAKFDTSVTGEIKLINKELTEDSGHIDTLDNHPLNAESGIAKVRVFQTNHGHTSATSDTFAGIPLSEINKTHTAVSDIEIDSYCISTTTAATATATGGGNAVLATRNIPFDLIHPIVSTIDFPRTTISSTVQVTSSTSLGGTETAYVKATEASSRQVVLNEDITFGYTGLVASKINETSNMNGENSLDINIKLTSENPNISPLIDTERMSVITASNRIDNINSTADIGAISEYVSSTTAEGDSNPAIYMTKKVVLELPATALRTMLAAAVQETSGIELYFKTLRTDSADIFDDIGWTAFNSNGTADKAVIPSKHAEDFKDHLYFSIKIVMKATDSTLVPLIKDFRTIALET